MDPARIHTASQNTRLPGPEVQTGEAAPSADDARTNIFYSSVQHSLKVLGTVAVLHFKLK